MPAWGQGVLEYVFIGVPEATGDITAFEVNGVDAFGGFQAYVDGDDNAIIVDGHKWWRTVDTQDGEFPYGGDIVQ